MEEVYPKDTVDKYVLIGFLKSIKNNNNIHIRSYLEDVSKNDDDYKQGYYKGFRDIAENQNRLIDNVLKKMEVE
ncbi:hypothetical protein [Clostridium coskatii]|uniref:Uncharacterized protein n=1 Tax=Clostridium coskatii TaxID=1705578 RepID=A0A162KV38_9CLOT|nr:hypothetical protein [Clostridium coskatii]OAA84456.1 hypothetical protein WX73_03488 [Clostridium coskatii]OBR94086.1 hypothetical protein CLCOS_20520 [Clostridium coskatii]